MFGHVAAMDDDVDMWARIAAEAMLLVDLASQS
jgi:hypothetical protein